MSWRDFIALVTIANGAIAAWLFQQRFYVVASSMAVLVILGLIKYARAH